MTARNPISDLPTHMVENQPAGLLDLNYAQVDPAFLEMLDREEAQWAKSDVIEFGAVMGSAAVRNLARLADKNPPELKPFDPYGRRLNEVEFHPAYHDLMKLAMQGRVHNYAWHHADKKGAHAAQIALAYLFNQTEGGVSCPMAMTYAVYPALKSQPDVFKPIEALLLSDTYDPRAIPAHEKSAMTMGMFMTEKQGGSDVRANTTKATPATGKSGAGAEYVLNGHKWFCSAPMSDAFLTLAQTENGLSCFYLPRWKPDGNRNTHFIQRLKDKVGNKSNASSEMEFVDCYAVMVGEEGRGVSTIIEMVQHTRLFCIMGSAAIMRAGLVHALYHVSHRRAFQRRLIDQPLMRVLLADLAMESEAAAQIMMRVAGSFDRAHSSPLEDAYKRIMTAVGKYWVCKRAPNFSYEAMECHGGMGYVEESPLGRLYRESPVNSIWEGSGNVMCLDVLRAISKEPDAFRLILEDLAADKGWHVDYDDVLERVVLAFQNGEISEANARWLTEQLAKLVQASLMYRNGPREIADCFASTRLGAEGGHVYGSLPKTAPIDAILSRAGLSLISD